MGVFHDRKGEDEVRREALEKKDPHERILLLFLVLVIFCLASVLKHLASTPTNQRHRAMQNDTHEDVKNSDPP